MFLFVTTTFAGVPNTMVYQGTLSQNDTPVNGTKTMKFRLWTEKTSGTNVWEETQPSVNINNGIFNILLGAVNPLSSTLFDGTTRYIEAIVVDGSDLSFGRQEIVTVGYAYKSVTAEKSDGNFIVAGNLGVGTTNPGKALDVVGEVRSIVGSTEFYMVPKGAIIMWSGSTADIPSSWALCDGAGSRPDLRDRFVLGINTGETPGLTGGTTYFTLTSVNQLPAHNHTATTSTDGLHGHTVSEATTSGLGRDVFTDASITSDGGSYAWRTGSEPLIHTNGNHSHTVTVNNTGTSAPVNFIPKYYKIAFIIKL